MGLSWRHIYFATIGLRFVFALSNSYIHPDEHFQSLEVLAGRIFGIVTSYPWEFQSAEPARSFAPLLLFYYLPLKVSHWLDFSPLQTWYIARLVMMVISWIITDWCLYQMLPTKQDRIKAIFFVSTSFVSLVYQSHTFSNSIETVLVVLTVYFINELRFWKTLPKNQYSKKKNISVSGVIGILFAIGVFNRVTFPAFFVLPSVFLLQIAWQWPYVPIMAATNFIIVSMIFILIDTMWFKGAAFSDIVHDPFTWSQYVVAPYNNLVYNTKVENLAQHGLHPIYTHILVNLPQIMGPGLILLFPRFKNKYWQTTPFLAAVSGMCFLSVVPHQELRFLIPIVPLLCCCLDVASLESVCKKVPWLPSVVMNSWLMFNVVMAVIMGVFHQGGVVPALDFLRASDFMGKDGLAFVFWRTYSPPTWMLLAKPGTLQINTGNIKNQSFQHDLVYDAMGMDVETLQETIQKFSKTHKQTYLIAPIASYYLIDKISFEEVWTYSYHLDMDHLDFSAPKTLQPGLGIYRLL